MADRITELMIKILASDEASGKLSKVGDTLSGIGKKMTLGVTLPIVAAATASVMAASDLEESVSKVNVVFGDAADSVKEFADSASRNLGITTQQALESAGTFGNLFTAMGIGQGVASDMSQELLTLGADLASFNNMDPTEALDKLKAGLVGETEPLRSLGVNINAAMIESRALELGLMSQGEALTAAAKAQASFSLIMDQTTTAQGDFARTSDGLANSMRIVKAQMGDMAAEMGTILLPIVTDIVSGLSGLLEKFQGLSPAAQKFIVIGLAIAAAIGPVLMIVGSLVSAITTIIPAVIAVAGVITGSLIPAIGAAIPLIISAIVAMAPILLIVAAIAAVIALLAVAWKNNWGGIQEKTKAAAAVIMGVIQKLWEGIKMVIETILAVIMKVFELFQAAFSGDWRRFGEIIRELWDMTWGKIFEILKQKWEEIKAFIPKAIQAIIDFFTQTDWKQVGIDIIKGIASGITSAIQWIKDAAAAAAQAAIDAAKGFLGIDSDSKMGIEIGENLSRAFGKGIMNNSQIPAMAMAGTAQAATTAIAPSGVGVGGPMMGGVATIEVNIHIDEIGDQIDLEMMAETVVRRIREISI